MVDSSTLRRLKNAIEFLKDNKSFKVGDLLLDSKDSISITVTGWTEFNHLKNLTKRQALKELNEIKELFTQLVTTSKNFADFSQNKMIKYCLGYDTGKGGIQICSEQNAKLVWDYQLRE